MACYIPEKLSTMNGQNYFLVDSKYVQYDDNSTLSLKEVIDDLSNVSYENFDETKTYLLGEKVLCNKNLYKCMVDSSIGTWNDTKQNFEGVIISSFKSWEQLTNYIEGELVLYNGCLYECLIAHTSTDNFVMSEEISDVETIYWELKIGIPISELENIFLTDDEMTLMLEDIFDVSTGTYNMADINGYEITDSQGYIIVTQ